MKQHHKRIRSMALVAAFCLLFSSLGFLSSSADGGYPTPSPVVINGKTVPLQLELYKLGDYYTQEGDSCGHHGSSECSFYDGCNCRVYVPTTGEGFPRGIQCYAFALDVYKRLFGYDVSNEFDHKVNWSCVNTDEFKANIQSIPAGSMVRAVTERTRSNHAFILMKATSEQVWIYQCNMYNACEVTAEIYTYQEFVRVFREIWYYVAPCRFTRTQTQHTVICTKCGKSRVEDHDYVSRPDGKLRCTICNFIKSAPGEIVSIDDEQEI